MSTAVGMGNAIEGSASAMILFGPENIVNSIPATALSAARQAIAGLAGSVGISVRAMGSTAGRMPHVPIRAMLPSQIKRELASAKTIGPDRTVTLICALVSIAMMHEGAMDRELDSAVKVSAFAMSHFSRARIVGKTFVLELSAGKRVSAMSLALVPAPALSLAFNSASSIMALLTKKWMTVLR